VVSERAGYRRYRSFSQLTTYLDCGEQYRLKYVEKHREQPAVWSVGGTAFHSCAEWFLPASWSPPRTASPTPGPRPGTWR
jgi:hypothetical protein